MEFTILTSYSSTNRIRCVALDDHHLVTGDREQDERKKNHAGVQMHASDQSVSLWLSFTALVHLRVSSPGNVLLVSRHFLSEVAFWEVAADLAQDDVIEAHL